MIRVRKAESHEYVLLSELGRKAFYEAFGEYNDPGDMQAYLDLAFNPETIKMHLSDPSVVYLIATYQNDPVGYAKMNKHKNIDSIKSKQQIQLERIYALGAHIGKKIGAALMQECIEIAKTENFEFMWLSVWQENSRAVSFYEKFGFIKIGVKKFMIGNEVNDDFVMSLNLSE